MANAAMMARQFRYLLAGAALASGVGLASVAQEPPAAAPAAIEEQLIGEIAPGTDLETLSAVLSPDGQRLAWRAKRNRKWTMTVNGEPGPEFDEVGAPRFSADSRRLAYAGKRGRSWLAVVDGKEGPPFEELSWPEFSADSQHVFYRAKRNKKWLAVVGGKEGPEFEEIRFLRLSADGQRVVYTGRRAKQWTLVVNGEPGPTYEEVRFLVLTPDGQHLAYAAKRNKKWLMVVDGKEGPECDDIDSPVLYSPDGQRLAYAAKRLKKWLMVVDGKEGSPADMVEALAFSADSRRYAYFSGSEAKGWKADWKSTIVVDGQEGPPFPGRGWIDEESSLASFLTSKIIKLTEFEEQGVILREYSYTLGSGLTQEHHHKYLRLAASTTGVSLPALSPDGHHVAYAARPEKNSAVVMQDGQAGPAFEGILTIPVFSPDSQRLAYVAWEKDKIIEVINGERKAEFAAEKGKNYVLNITFSPDGQRFAYVLVLQGTVATGRARRRVAVDGKAGKEYNALAVVDLKFSPDSRHLAYLVRDPGDNKWVVVLDAQEGKLYDAILEGTLSFSEENEGTYVAQVGNRYYRVKHKAP
ncbi:MAG: WD40 repeat domain-containing protein [Candidatus Acidiferrales bacterium]